MAKSSQDGHVLRCMAPACLRSGQPDDRREGEGALLSRWGRGLPTGEEGGGDPEQEEERWRWGAVFRVRLCRVRLGAAGKQGRGRPDFAPT